MILKVDFATTTQCCAERGEASITNLVPSEPQLFKPRAVLEALGESASASIADLVLLEPQTFKAPDQLTKQSQQ